MINTLWIKLQQVPHTIIMRHNQQHILIRIKLLQPRNRPIADLEIMRKTLGDKIIRLHRAFLPMNILQKMAWTHRDSRNRRRIKCARER